MIGDSGCALVKYRAIEISSSFNKFTSVFYASVLLLMINCVITSKWLWNHEPQAHGSAVNFYNVVTKFVINLFLTITRPQNGQMPGNKQGEKT